MLVYFNPRTPRGVRLRDSESCEKPLDISIHAPREGCDTGLSCCLSGHGYFNPRTPRGVRLPPVRGINGTSRFQSTHPARGATRCRECKYYKPEISIHAPREGCDPCRGILGAEGGFQSTHPARGATWPPVWIRRGALFQSTHPARGATANFTKEQRVCLAQFAYLHKGKKAEHTKTNAPMLHEAFLYAFWVRTGRRRRVLLDFARYKIKGSSGR